MTRILSKYKILTPSMEQLIESDNPKMYPRKVNQILFDAMRFAGVHYVTSFTDDLPDPHTKTFDSVCIWNVGSGETYYICNLIKHYLFFESVTGVVMTWDNIRFIEVRTLA